MGSLTGYSKVCGLQSGGMKSLYMAICADVTSFTLQSTSYSAATMESGKVFKEYQFEQDSFELKEAVTLENRSKKVTHTIEFYLAKMSATSRAALQEIIDNSDCGLVAICEDNNGVKWTVGYSESHLKTRALELKSGALTSGKKLSDPNGTTITLESEDTDLMRIFTGTIPTT